MKVQMWLCLLLLNDPCLAEDWSDRSLNLDLHIQATNVCNDQQVNPLRHRRLCDLTLSPDLVEANAAGSISLFIPTDRPVMSRMRLRGFGFTYTNRLYFGEGTNGTATVRFRFGGGKIRFNFNLTF